MPPLVMALRETVPVAMFSGVTVAVVEVVPSCTFWNWPAETSIRP